MLSNSLLLRRERSSSRANSKSLSRAASKGSVLIVALILCAVIGISLASYLQLTRSTMKMSSRAFYSNASINLAELGLEQAMWSLNKMVAGDPTAAWSGWTITGANAQRTFSGYTFDQNATGFVRVHVSNYLGTSGTPQFTTRATITPASGAVIEKWVQVTLSPRSKFSNGLVAKDSIRFRGNNASVDSWNSDPDNDTSTPAIPYSASVRNDNGSIGSASVSVGAIAMQNADIWGYVATGGEPPTIGNQGLVGPFGTAAGTMDPTRVSTDFTASFDVVAAPTTAGYTIGAITSNTTLPRGADTPAADGKYYYSAPSVNLNNQTLTISNKVVLTLTSTSKSIDIGGGSGELHINSGATLECYAAGDVKIAGNGLFNGCTNAAAANQPISCQFYGTGTSPAKQNYQIAGNGTLNAIIYAPNASLKVNGNGNVSGSFVANDITLVGNAAFHYDESLGNFGGNSPYGITNWEELTSSESRTAVSHLLSF